MQHHVPCLTEVGPRIGPGNLASLVLLAVALVGAPAARAAATAEELRARADQLVAQHAPAAIAARHTIHQNPELGYEEVATAKLVADELRRLGFEVQTGVAKTGVVGLLRGGQLGPVVAVRADMDALPVVENTDLPFGSTKRTTYLGQEVGVSHACGHDVHTAIGLGVAATLAALREELPGTVKFLFQPAEEGAPPGGKTGAQAMLEAGAFADPRPDFVLGLHALAENEGEPFAVGEVGWIAGPNFAAVDHFVATLRGRPAHGAYPHQSVDPVVMAAQAIMALQTIRSRTLDPREPSVVTVGVVRGGQRFNIIPSEVTLEGTVRSFGEATRATVERRMREILDGVVRAAGGEGFELVYEHTAPPLLNDPELARRLRPTLARVVGDERVLDARPVTIGEDFAYFANQVPGFFYRLGVVAPGTTSGGNHTPEFRADDSAIAVGMRTMTHLVIDLLQGAATATTPAR